MTIYLYNVGRLVNVLFEDQHSWSISVNIELFLQIGSLREALVHIAKLQVVLISKSCQLWRRRETLMMIQWRRGCISNKKQQDKSLPCRAEELQAFGQKEAHVAC